jgi:hypothetical protein
MPRKKREKQYQGHTATPYRPTVRTVRASLTTETGDGQQDGHIWLARIAKTKRAREEMRNGAKDWRRYMEWFEGEQWMERGEDVTIASDNARNTATVNVTGSIALSYMPFLINGQIKFKLKARKPSDAVSAEIQQGLLNYEWMERGMTEEAKRIVQDVVTIGHGIGKTGYVIEVDEARRKSDGEINYKDYIRKDAAYIERVDPLSFLFDLSAKDGTLKTARWCAECFFATYDDVMANANYDQSVLERIHAGNYSFTTHTGFHGVGADDPQWGQRLTAAVPEDRLVALWEIWDKKFRKRYIFAEGVPVPLVEESWPYDYLDGFPFVKIDYIRVANKPYGMGVMRQAEDQQIQLNRIRTAQFNHVRSHQRKFLAIAGAISNEEVKNFADLPDGAVLTAERPDAIQPIPDAPMSQDFQVVEARIASDIQQLTGADALLQGRPLPSRTTAGEVSARTNILRLKADDRVSAVEVGVTELARQVMQHLKAHRTLPDVVEIVGAQGAYWKEYTSEEIQADVDVSVEYFAAPKFDPALDRQQRLQILQLGVQALPAMQAAGAQDALDIPALFGWVLESFEQKDAGRFFKPALIPQPPLVEQEPTAGQGLPPALAGDLAPAPLPEEANAGMFESPDVEALLMQLRGQGIGGTGQLPQV